MVPIIRSVAVFVYPRRFMLDDVPPRKLFTVPVISGAYIL